ncbi:MAG: helix-turn-helix domain-containing protein [Desulfitobacteriia bacterium]|jgi:cytoskeleton protein RodZ
MAGEGQILRNAREEKGWSYQDVEKALKIRVRYLQALENEEYNILPGTAYTKGFLRTYARHLNLDPEEIISLFNASSEEEKENIDHLPLKPISNSAMWFKPAIILVMALVAIGIILGIYFFSKGNSDPKNSYNPPPLPSSPAEENSESLENEESLPPESPSSEEEPFEEEIYSGIVAELSFTQDCWMVAKVDGQTKINGMNAAGTSQVLQGEERIDFISIGNAGGVVLKLNGIDVGPIGAAGEVISNFSLTEETLKELSAGNDILP